MEWHGHDWYSKRIVDATAMQPTKFQPNDMNKYLNFLLLSIDIFGSDWIDSGAACLARCEVCAALHMS
jgi:hypothetical protein